MWRRPAQWMFGGFAGRTRLRMRTQVHAHLYDLYVEVRSLRM